MSTTAFLTLPWKIQHFDLYQILWTYLVHNVIIYQTGTEENFKPEEWDNKVQRWVDKMEKNILIVRIVSLIYRKT